MQAILCCGSGANQTQQLEAALYPITHRWHGLHLCTGIFPECVQLRYFIKETRLCFIGSPLPLTEYSWVIQCLQLGHEVCVGCQSSPKE